MNRDEIQVLVPGPELNALVAVEVMGKEVQGGYVLPITPRGERVRNYSGNHSAAIDVVMKTSSEAAEGWEWFFCFKHIEKVDKWWVVKVLLDDQVDEFIHASTLPEAVCKAALLAKLETE